MRCKWPGDHEQDREHHNPTERQVFAHRTVLRSVIPDPPAQGAGFHFWAISVFRALDAEVPSQ